jgi:hypothetical protein
MKTPDEFARLMGDKNPNLAKRPEGGFTVSTPKETHKLTGLEYFWCALPIGVMVIGGAVGGLFAGMAVTGNLAIFRSNRTPSEKYALSSVVLIGTFVAWWIAALTLMTIFPDLRRH